MTGQKETLIRAKKKTSQTMARKFKADLKGQPR